MYALVTPLLINSFKIKGVPQGSVLSVTLFNIHIVTYFINFHLQYEMLYVDDLQVSCQGSDMRLIERRLQTTVNRLVQWCDQNGHTISPSKSSCPFLQETSPKRHCCRVSAADKGVSGLPLDPRPDAVALYSGCTSGLVLPNLSIDETAQRVRFLLISLPNNALSIKSPFTIHKALKGIGGEPKSVKKDCDPVIYLLKPVLLRRQNLSYFRKHFSIHL
ncbi:putative RNA-directed DNA polymerase from transposon BS [Trichonephila clavipes]|nr:putative RNA-directed DNA polymerase from transposon BS [Trichonephila clavipes]